MICQGAGAPGSIADLSPNRFCLAKEGPFLGFLKRQRVAIQHDLKASQSMLNPLCRQTVKPRGQHDQQPFRLPV